VFALAGGFVVIQAIYYAVYFSISPQLAVRGRMPSPALWLPGMMGILLCRSIAMAGCSCACRSC